MKKTNESISPSEIMKSFPSHAKRQVQRIIQANLDAGTLVLTSDMRIAAAPAVLVEEKAWQPMATAPVDGKHCILAVKEGAFIYSVQGAFHAGQWNVVHRDNVQPLCWMPNIRLPDEFLATLKSEEPTR